jgi:hypothetical protein
VCSFSFMLQLRSKAHPAATTHNISNRIDLVRFALIVLEMTACPFSNRIDQLNHYSMGARFCQCTIAEKAHGYATASRRGSFKTYAPANNKRRTANRLSVSTFLR